jgi:hypothetical protein
MLNLPIPHGKGFKTLVGPVHVLDLMFELTNAGIEISLDERAENDVKDRYPDQDIDQNRVWFFGLVFFIHLDIPFMLFIPLS